MSDTPSPESVSVPVPNLNCDALILQRIAFLHAVIDRAIKNEGDLQFIVIGQGVPYQVNGKPVALVEHGVSVRGLVLSPGQGPGQQPVGFAAVVHIPLVDISRLCEPSVISTVVKS